MKKNDLIGIRFGKLVVLKPGKKVQHGKRLRTTWFCKCDCGGTVNVVTNDLTRKTRQGTSSCGCLYRTDLTNKQFGSLIVVNYEKTNVSKNGDRSAMWNCKCACGKKCLIRASDLLSKHTKSCGCSRHLKGNKSYRWKGCGDLSGQYVSRMNKNAQNRNMDVKVDAEFLWNLFVFQNGKCALSGQEISIKKHPEMTASVDRIDSNFGYIEGNLQWVHKDINRMKQNFDEKYFLETCNRIINYRKKDL